MGNILGEVIVEEGNLMLIEGEQRHAEIVHSTTKPRITSPFWQGFLWGAIFSSTAVISGVIGATLAIHTPLSNFITSLPKIHLSEQLKPEEPLEPEPIDKDWISRYTIAKPVNILVMGIDTIDTATDRTTNLKGDSNTIFLLRCEPEENSLRLISIPSNTLVKTNSLAATISRVNAYGGLAETKKKLSQALNNITIHRSIVIDTATLQKMVDLLGGVKLYVPEKMLDNIRSQDSTIALKPGWQTLSGKQAEEFIYFRSESTGELGKIQRQQLFLQALFQQLHNPSLMSRLPQVVKIISQGLDTDLTSTEMMALTSLVVQTEASQLNMFLLPGAVEAGFTTEKRHWVTDNHKKDQLLKEYFSQSPAFARFEQQPVVTPFSRLHIAIQNTIPDRQSGHRVLYDLRKKSLRNVYISDNLNLQLLETEIIVQQGNLEAGKQLQEILGFGKLVVSATGDLDSDLTIRLGQIS